MTQSARPVRVVITGYGAICPLGKDSNEIWQAVMNKERGYAVYNDPGKDISTRIFGKINFPLNTEKFSKRIVKNLSRFAELALIAADEAYNMAFQGQTGFVE